MDEAEYLREQATKYNERARMTIDPKLHAELLDLVTVCEDAAVTIEERAPGG